MDLNNIKLKDENSMIISQQIPLPPEVLSMCFEYLNTEDLLAVNRTCKQFSVTLEMVPRINSKLPLIVQDSFAREENCQEIVERSRFQYENLIVEFLNAECLKMISEFAESIKELTLNFTEPVEFRLLRKLLTNLPNVEKLVVRSIQKFHESEVKGYDSQIILPNLKTLEYLSENSQLLKIFRNNSIENFDTYNSDMKAFWKFLRNQNSLKNVVIWKDVFFPNQVFLSTTLESLIINVQMSFPNVNFLYAFKSMRSLKKLVYASNNPKIDIRVFETIFNDMTNLQEIYLNITDETFSGNDAILQEYLEHGPDEISRILYNRVCELLIVNLDAYFNLVKRNDDFFNLWIDGEVRYSAEFSTFIDKYRRELFLVFESRRINLTRFIVMFFGPFEEGRQIVNRMNRLMYDAFFNWVRVNPRAARINFSPLLEWLDIPLELPNHQHFVFRGQIIQATEKLTLHGRNTVENLQNIIKIYPNLKTLKLLKQLSINDELMKFLASYLDLLENLTLEFSEGKSKWEENIKFRNLKKVHFKSFQVETEAFLNFFEQNQLLEEITFEACSKLNDIVLEKVVKALPNLKHLEILGVNNLTEYSVELLVENCPSLKYLTIKRKSFQPFKNFQRLYEKSGLKLHYNVQN